MARHRSPGGRCTVPAYLPESDARRPQATWPPATSSAPEAPTLIMAVPPRGERRSTRHRAPAKPLIRGNTVVSATAALGAVVTGGLLAANSGAANSIADATETTLIPTDLAARTQPLTVQPVSTGTVMSDSSPRAPHQSATAATTLLPVAAPDDRVAAADQRDVESLHKAEQLAAEASATHAKADKEALILRGGGGLDDWISVALAKMDLPQSFAGGIKRVIMAESRGNPNAVNRTDSNALAGRPSQGLMQVIPGTFRAYVLPELANRPITDPVANITAGVRYMIANYGLNTVRSGGRSDSGGNYLGY